VRKKVNRYREVYHHGSTIARVEQEQGGWSFFAACEGATKTWAKWKNAINADDNPQINGIFPRPRLRGISRSPRRKKTNHPAPAVPHVFARG